MLNNAYSFGFLDQAVRYLWRNGFFIDDEREVSALEFTICRIVAKVFICDCMFGWNANKLVCEFISRMALQAMFSFLRF